MKTLTGLLSLSLGASLLTIVCFDSAKAATLGSAAFQPRQGQLVAQTTLGLQRTGLHLRSLQGADHGVSRFGLITQAFDYGLNTRTTLSLSQTVAHAFQKNPLNPFEGKTGLRGPKLGTAYRFEPAASVILRPHLELQVNPATRSRLNYVTAGTQVLWSPSLASQWLLGAEWSATRHHDIRSESAAWGLLAAWGNPNYNITLRYSRAQLNSFTTTHGTYSKSPYTRWKLEIARSLNHKTWVFVGFEEEQSRGRFMPTFPPLAVDNQRKQHTLSTGLKWYFYP